MTKEKSDLKVGDVVGGTKKSIFKNMRFSFKSEGLHIETDAKYERLNAKKIMPFEEFEQDKTGKRVKAKLVGYKRGDKNYYPAIQNEKGKWVADDDKAPIDEDNVEKVVRDTRTDEVKRKDTNKGLWFMKTAPMGVINDWHIEDTYNLWAEENADNLLKVYELLVEKGLVGVYKFNPNGTAYNAFLIPQRVDGSRFRLLLHVARVKLNKPEITPTMTVVAAEAQKREKERIERVGVASALEEV